MIQKILFFLFRDLEFMKLRKEAIAKHPDKLDEITKISDHYIYETASDIHFARRAFASLTAAPAKQEGGINE